MQLVALSQFHLQQLMSLPELDQDDTTWSFIVSIYKPRLRVLCEGYDHYLSGFPDAILLLQSLRENQDKFGDFVQLQDDELEDGMSVEQFIQMPLKVSLQQCFHLFIHTPASYSFGLSVDVKLVFFVSDSIYKTLCLL